MYRAEERSADSRNVVPLFRNSLFICVMTEVCYLWERICCEIRIGRSHSTSSYFCVFFFLHLSETDVICLETAIELFESQVLRD
jgi:hypothetical protein